MPRRQRKVRKFHKVPRSPVTGGYVNKTYKILIRQDLTETVAKWPVPVWVSFDEPLKYHPALANFTACRVKEIRICVPPESYVETVIREAQNAYLNTRRELRNQQDVMIVGRAGRPRPVYLRRRPGQAIYKGWQDVNPDGIKTGMWANICGKNDLEPDSSGILCAMEIVLEAKGFNTGIVARDAVAFDLFGQPTVYDQAEIAHRMERLARIESQHGRDPVVFPRDPEPEEQELEDCYEATLCRTLSSTAL